MFNSYFDITRGYMRNLREEPQNQSGGPGNGTWDDPARNAQGEGSGGLDSAGESLFLMTCDAEVALDQPSITR